MRKTLVVASTALVLGAFAGLGSPASAGDTTTTFSVTSGSLAVSAPASKALGTGAAGTSVTAQLGDTTVTDARAALLGSWTATVVSSAFTATVSGQTQTIPATAVSYWSGLATATTGLGVPVPGQALAINAVAIDTAKTAFSKAAGVGSNSTTWNPTVVVAVPAAAVAGDYTGTITHSVA